MSLRFYFVNLEITLCKKFLYNVGLYIFHTMSYRRTADPIYHCVCWCRIVCLCTGEWKSRECVVIFILTEPSHDFVYWNPIIVGWELCLVVVRTVWHMHRMENQSERNWDNKPRTGRTLHNEKWCQIKYTKAKDNIYNNICRLYM